MGQKVNPTGFRLGISKKQNANWYAKGKDFSTNLIQDLKVREYFKTKLKNSSISKIELERSAENFVVSIYFFNIFFFEFFYISKFSINNI